VTAVLLTQASLALGQGGSAGGSSGSSSGSTGSTGATSGAPGTSTSAPQNSIPSGTGPTPAPTPGQSFSFPSNSGTPGTGSNDARIPSGTGPAPAPTPGQSTSVPSGSSGHNRIGTKVRLRHSLNVGRGHDRWRARRALLTIRTCREPAPEAGRARIAKNWKKRCQAAGTRRPSRAAFRREDAAARRHATAILNLAAH